MGVVYHANYLVWMEIGRVELLRSRGCNYTDLEREGFHLAVIETRTRHLSPARYDQEIVVETEIVDANPRIVEFAYQIRCASGNTVLVQGATRHLWLNRDWRPTRLPDQYRHLLRVG